MNGVVDIDQIKRVARQFLAGEPDVAMQLLHGLNHTSPLEHDFEHLRVLATRIVETLNEHGVVKGEQGRVFRCSLSKVVRADGAQFTVLLCVTDRPKSHVPD